MSETKLTVEPQKPTDGVEPLSADKEEEKYSKEMAAALLSEIRRRLGTDEDRHVFDRLPLTDSQKIDMVLKLS